MPRLDPEQDAGVQRGGRAGGRGAETHLHPLGQGSLKSALKGQRADVCPNYDGKFRLPLVLTVGRPIFHSNCEGTGAVLSLAQTHRGRPQITSTRLYAGEAAIWKTSNKRMLLGSREHAKHLCLLLITKSLKISFD